MGTLIFVSLWSLNLLIKRHISSFSVSSHAVCVSLSLPSENSLLCSYSLLPTWLGFYAHVLLSRLTGEKLTSKISSWFCRRPCDFDKRWYFPGTWSISYYSSLVFKSRWLSLSISKPWCIESFLLHSCSWGHELHLHSLNLLTPISLGWNSKSNLLKTLRRVLSSFPTWVKTLVIFSLFTWMDL